MIFVLQFHNSRNKLANKSPEKPAGYSQTTVLTYSAGKEPEEDKTCNSQGSKGLRCRTGKAMGLARHNFLLLLIMVYRNRSYAPISVDKYMLHLC
jgi:hypothetical protein